jgi:hypothetical protein
MRLLLATLLLSALLPIAAQSSPPPAAVQGTAVTPQADLAPAALPSSLPAWAQIPSTAIASGILDGAKHWHWNHDPYTGGNAQPSSNYPVYPDGRAGYAGRQFVSPYSGGPHAGALWHLSFGFDSEPQHFAYTAKVYLVDPSQIENVEMDMNQVMRDGRTVIFGLQCAGGSKTWEYTTVSGHDTHWHRSNIACNPANWGVKKWHEVALFSERDDDGNVTYDGVCFDQVCQAFQGASGPSALPLKWKANELLLNYQTDCARASGTMDSYMRDLQIYRW